MFVGECQMQDLNEYYRRVFKISNYIIELYNSRPDECSMHTRIHDAVEFGPNFFYGVTPNDGSLLLNISSEHRIPVIFKRPQFVNYFERTPRENRISLIKFIT